MSQRRASRRPIVEEPEVEENFEDEEIEETRPRRKFQPNRKPIEPAEEEYDDDRRRFTKPIEVNSELMKDCINTAHKFNFIDLLNKYVEVD